MPEQRHESTLIDLSFTRPRVATGLREAMRGGYGRAQFKSDILAGTMVGVVALPLSMAFAIASGVAPQNGLYAAIVAGFIVALLGGSRVQVTGPTAAFVAVLAPIAGEHGLAGLLIASVMSGVILVLMGLARMGRLITFIPYPVTAGFTAGIAVVIATLQVRDFLGLDIGTMPNSYVGKVMELTRAMPTWKASDLIVGAATLAVLVLWPRVTKKFPAPLIGLLAGTAVALALAHLIPGFSVATIGSRFDGGIPQVPPLFSLPWKAAGPAGAEFVMSVEVWQDLAKSATAMAMLGAIATLLCAVVSDGVTGYKHDPDAELIALGAGNIIGPFFGGIVASGAIARTSTNIRCGAKTPISSMVHCVFVLLAMLILSPWLSYLPMASMAAMLLTIAWNMAEAKHFVHVMRTAPKSDALVLATCFVLTVVFDMALAVMVGVVLAALLFMRRMADLTGGEMLAAGHPHFPQGVPPGVVVYEIAGPLFFGAAQRAMSSLYAVQPGVRTVMLDLRSVPAIDATGLVNLESTLKKLWGDGIMVVIAGIQPGPMHTMVKSGMRNERGRLMLCREYDTALDFVRSHGRHSGVVELPEYD